MDAPVVEFTAPSPLLWPSYLIPTVTEIRRRYALLGKPPETVTKEIQWNMTGQRRRSKKTQPA